MGEWEYFHNFAPDKLWRNSEEGCRTLDKGEAENIPVTPDAGNAAVGNCEYIVVYRFPHVGVPLLLEIEMIRAGMYYLTTLSIAGSDSSGGAGIAADLKTMSALGCYASCVITAVTAQNTCGVRGIHDIPSEMVSAQIKAVMDDIAPLAVKVGMVNRPETIRAIADTLRAYEGFELVVDSVMVASSGDRLMAEDALAVFCTDLLPMATLLTPNIPEAEMLSGIAIRNGEDIGRAARKILSMGCGAVLMKGGHLKGDRKTDWLFGKDGLVKSYEASTIQTRNTHGTGCTLSSAITCYLAMGKPLPMAVSLAKEYVTAALSAGGDVHIGKGAGPVNHFFNPQKLIIES